MHGSVSFLFRASSFALLSVLLATTASASDSNDAPGCRRPLGVGEPIGCASQQPEPDYSAVAETIDDYRERVRQSNADYYDSLRALNQRPERPVRTAEVVFNPRGMFYVVSGLDIEANDPEAVRALASFSSLPPTEVATGNQSFTLLDVKRRAQYWEDNPFQAMKRKYSRGDRPPSQIALYLIEGATHTADQVAERLDVDRSVAVARMITVATSGQPLTWSSLRMAAPTTL
jgi:hypothetical protein